MLYYNVKCVCNERRHTHNEVREKRSTDGRRYEKTAGQ